MSGRLEQVIVTPTITASSAYASGNALGGQILLLKLANYGMTTLRGLVLTDKANQKAAIDVLFFNQSFTATADKSAIAISNADLLNSQGSVNVPTTAYITVGTGAVATLQQNLWLPLVALGSNDIYAQLVVRGTPTFASTTDITVKFIVEYMDSRSPS